MFPKLVRLWKIHSRSMLGPCHISHKGHSTLPSPWTFECGGWQYHWHQNLTLTWPTWYHLWNNLAYLYEYRQIHLVFQTWPRERSSIFIWGSFCMLYWNYWPDQHRSKQGLQLYLKASTLQYHFQCMRSLLYRIHTFYQSQLWMVCQCKYFFRRQVHLW